MVRRDGLGDQLHLDDRVAAILTRDQELWGVALWVEKAHSENAQGYMAEQVTRLAEAGDAAGIAMWRAVAERYDKLRENTSIN